MNNNSSLLSALKAVGVLDDASVAGAFEAVPRGLFLPDVPDEQVYRDIPIYTRTDDEGGFLGGSDQPSQVANLLTLAALEPGMNVLHIGTGTGYTAALIQQIVGERGRVTTLEIDRETAEKAENNLSRNRMNNAVHVVRVDAAGGYAPRASYDRIIASVGLWDIPDVWVKQLRREGLIVAPIFLDGLQVMGAFGIGEDVLYSDNNISCSFVPITGVEAPPGQHLYMGGGSALRLYSNEVKDLDSARLHLLMSDDAEYCHLGAAPTHDEYWNGFAPYLMMNVPDGYDFACYVVEGDKQVYGLNHQGFALITQGGATFVGTQDMGNTHCFGGGDAFLEIDRLYQEWLAADEPRIDKMRVRLIPKEPDEGEGRIPTQGYIYKRPYHQLHVYMDYENNRDD